MSNVGTIVLHHTALNLVGKPHDASDTHMKNQFLKIATILYILLPSFLFVYGWLKLPIAIAILIILVSFTVTMLIDAFRTSSDRHIFGIKLKQAFSRNSISGVILPFLLIIIWLAFSGVGGAGFQNTDYRANNALLKDLIIQDWPLRVTLDGIQVPVVYYIAYYLPASVIGKAFGWIYANIAIFIWTLIGIMLAYAWFKNIGRISFKDKSFKSELLLAEIFCLAGGLDYIGYYLLNRNIPRVHIEMWAGYFEYSSNTTLIYWVPQHAIISWLIIGILVDTLYNKQNIKHLGMVVAAGIIWSPFGIVGVLPYLLLILFNYLLPQNRGYLFNRASITFNTLSIGVGSIYSLYIASNRFKFPIGFIWQYSEDPASLALRILIFLCLEFVLLGFLTLLFIVLGTFYFNKTALSSHNWHILLDQEFGITPMQLYLFLISLGILGILPLFNMGFNNDLVMRASITSLFIFWAFIAKVVADTSPRIKKKFNLLYSLISIILILGFLTSFNEIARSVAMYHFGPPALSDVSTTADVNEIKFNLQRIGDEDTIFYHYLSK